MCHKQNENREFCEEPLLSKGENFQESWRVCLLSVRGAEGNAPGEDFSREKGGEKVGWGLTLLAIDTLTIGREEEEGG